MKGQRIIRVFQVGANRLKDPADPVLRFVMPLGIVRISRWSVS